MASQSLSFGDRFARKIQLEYPKELINELREMVAIKSPCFIYGECGKTVLIKSCFPDVKVYDTREILETKNISGFYSIRNNTLEYTNGILIEAMLKGYKICFKNIDANLSLLQYLKPVIRNRKIVNSFGDDIFASDDFRIFFTCKEPLKVKNVIFIGPIRFTLESTLALFKDISCSFEVHKPLSSILLNVLDFMLKNRNERCPRNDGLACSQICLKDELKCDCLNNKTNYLCSKHFRKMHELSDILHLEYENGNAFRLVCIREW
ncbi:uncharacterized protein VICG_01539 [Vittaforma corneae ATCC 50505]|uniref:Uncharacterized protein n=1 Tax=Vittaforma corneae (strain ATCC 50505) TaxID=993615 RepID=L2GLB4_VITCO|nr:uncharacterized protein VICG_01539 [Vittaforma corneae ATCC 50505]ELA41434.1 hypothetical protein VICG_01539 [Vittaforma corneae ATCC 50505]